MSGTREFVLQAVARAIKPILRLCLRHSIKLQELYEILKVAFVQVAEEELKRAGDAASASRISAATGVHRRDIAEIQARGGAPKRRENLVSKVMAQWQLDPRFSTKGKKPRVLSCEGADSEFANLVSAVNGGDVSGYAVLFEMERLKIVERRGNKIKLCWRDYAPEPTVESGLTMLADDTEDLYQAVTENVFEDRDPKNLHLKTVFDRIDPEAVPTIRSWMIEEGSNWQKKVREFLAQYDRDLAPRLDKSGPSARIAVGTFSVIGEGDVNN